MSVEQQETAPLVAVAHALLPHIPIYALSVQQLSWQGGKVVLGPCRNKPRNIHVQNGTKHKTETNDREQSTFVSPAHRRKKRQRRLPTNRARTYHTSEARGVEPLALFLTKDGLRTDKTNEKACKTKKNVRRGRHLPMLRRCASGRRRREGLYVLPSPSAKS